MTPSVAKRIKQQQGITQRRLSRALFQQYRSKADIAECETDVRFNPCCNYALEPKSAQSHAWGEGNAPTRSHAILKDRRHRVAVRQCSKRLTKKPSVPMAS